MQTRALPGNIEKSMEQKINLKKLILFSKKFALVVASIHPLYILSLPPGARERAALMSHSRLPII